MVGRWKRTRLQPDKITHPDFLSRQFPHEPQYFVTMKQLKKDTEIGLPDSVVDGIAWPALPSPDVNAVLSLAYQIDQSQWWTPEVLRAFQLRQVDNLIRHARNTVPFYRQRLVDVTDVSPGMLSMDDVRQIPLLQKSDIQDCYDDLKSDAMPKSHLPVHKIVTSGSTGPPATLIGTSVTAVFHSALTIRWHTWHKRNFNLKMAELLHYPTAGSEEPQNRKGWGRGFASGPRVSFTANQPVKEQIDWLVDEDPYYLVTFPSNLNALLRHCEKYGVRIPNLHVVSTRGMAIGDDTRELCEQVWGITLKDAYGAEECGYIALQCPDASGYHVQSEHLLVEVLDDEGNAAEPGCTGRVVITDLHNFATPLIRYEVGDFAIAGSDCSCGRGLPVIEQILGRYRSTFMLPSGDRFFPLYSKALFQLKKDIPSIQEAQLVQRSRPEITARLIVSRPLDQNEEMMIKTELAKAMGGEFEIVIEYVEALHRSASGKFEETICEIAD